MESLDSKSLRQVRIDAIRQLISQDPNISSSQIFKQTGIPPRTASRLRKEMESAPPAEPPKQKPPSPPKEKPPPEISTELGISTEELEALLSDTNMPNEVDELEAHSINGITAEHYQHNDKSVRKILSFGDMHCPFVLVDALRKAVQLHQDADVVAIPGDFLDAWGLSAFYKEPWVDVAMSRILIKHYHRNPQDAEKYGYKIHPMLAEVFAGKIVLEYILRAFKNLKSVIVSWGNHEARLKRYLEKRDVQHMLGIETENVLDVFKGMDPRLRIVDHWHFSINDLLLCHPSNFSQIFGKTASQCLDFFLDKHDPHIPFNAIVVAHTHMSSQGRRRGRLMIEPGCLCRHAYGDDGRISSVVSSPGYGVIIQNEGITDLTASGYRLV